MGRLKCFVAAGSFFVIFLQAAFGGTYGGGSGTAGDPYLISTAEHMQEIGANVGDWGEHFLLTADIDMGAYTGEEYNIIGNMTDKFIGVFDGGGNNVINLTYSSSSQTYVGLFGAIGSGGQVRELGVVGVNIDTGESSYAGGIAGVSYGEIYSCFVSGSVSGGLRIGGFAGGNGNGASMVNCYCACSVDGNDEVGGFVGANDGEITKCYSIGTVNGNIYVGGLAGRNYGGTYASSFWNSETNPGLTGVGNIGDPAGVIGKTTAELQIQSTFTGAGWDFVGESINGTEDIWDMPGCGYPVLWWQGVGTVPDVSGLSEVEAISMISSAGLTTVVQTASSGIVPEGYVISQEPAAGCEATVVTLVVSSGFPFEGGSGTEGDPYLISTAEQMQKIGVNPDNWDKHFLLTADIDLGAYSYSTALIAPDIDNTKSFFQGTPFTGVFDGNGYVISNLTIDPGSLGNDYLGLFGGIDGSATVKNLGMENVNIIARSNSKSIGGISGGVPWNKNIQLINCYVTGSISGGDYVGGLIGGGRGSRIKDCYFSGNISGDDYVGGLVGYGKSSSIRDCYVKGSVTGGDYVGGLGGRADYIFDSYAAVNIIGAAKVGGLAGYGQVEIENCYSMGTVRGVSEVGGLVGNNFADMQNNYSMSIVSGGATLGGIVGMHSMGGSPGIQARYYNCFWNSEINPGLLGFGNSGNANVNEVMSRTTSELETQSTFTSHGWDFVGEDVNGTDDVWRICVDGVGYPALSWEYDRVGDFVCPDGVGVEDVSILADGWLGGDGRADLNGDGIVDLLDYALFAAMWI